MAPKAGLGNRRMGEPRAPPGSSPAPPRSRTLVLRPLSEEIVEALLARLRLLRGLPSSIGGLRREKRELCAPLSADDPGGGTETGSGACRSEEAEEKEPVV